MIKGSELQILGQTPTVRENYGKTKHSKVRVSYIFCVKQKSIHFQNMGKVNSHSTGKVWENTNVPKL